MQQQEQTIQKKKEMSKLISRRLLFKPPASAQQQFARPHFADPMLHLKPVKQVSLPRGAPLCRVHHFASQALVSAWLVVQRDSGQVMSALQTFVCSGHRAARLRGVSRSCQANLGEFRAFTLERYLSNFGLSLFGGTEGVPHQPSNARGLPVPSTALTYRGPRDPPHLASYVHKSP